MFVPARLLPRLLPHLCFPPLRYPTLALTPFLSHSWLQPLPRAFSHVTTHLIPFWGDSDSVFSPHLVEASTSLSHTARVLVADTDLSTARPCFGEGQWDSGWFFPVGGLKYVFYWIRIAFIYIFRLSGKCSRTCAFCSAQCENWKAPVPVIWFLGWKVVSNTALVDAVFLKCLVLGITLKHFPL